MFELRFSVNQIAPGKAITNQLLSGTAKGRTRREQSDGQHDPLRTRPDHVGGRPAPGCGGGRRGDGLAILAGHIGDD
jgi:hypothetical protein